MPEAAKKTTPAKPKRAHEVGESTTSLPAGAQGGTASARCSCGWTETASYSRDRFRDQAVSEVRASGEAHVRGANDPHVREASTDA